MKEINYDDLGEYIKDHFNKEIGEEIYISNNTNDYLEDIRIAEINSTEKVEDNFIFKDMILELSYNQKLVYINLSKEEEYTDNTLEEIKNTKYYI